MAELKETREQVDDIETLRASYEVQLTKAKSQYEAAQADITNLILDVREGEESNEVTFRTTTEEYDPACAVCHVRDLLHVVPERHHHHRIRVRSPHGQKNNR